MIHFDEVERSVMDILKNADGKYLFPYQIFTRFRGRDPELGQKIENEYPVQTGNLPMGAGAGIYYSPASFIAQALNHFFKNNCSPLFDKRWFDSGSLDMEGIIPGSKEGTSIWAWNPRNSEFQLNL